MASKPSALPWLFLALACVAAMPARATPAPPTLADQVRSAVPRPDGVKRIEVSVDEIDARLKLAPCARIEPVIPAGQRLWGKVRIELRCVEGARWRVYVPVQVRVIGAGFVAARALPAGAVLAAEDLRPADIDLAADPQGMVSDVSLAAGRPLARPVVAGQPLAQADVRARQWFAAGDTIQVIAAGGGFRLTGIGQAASPGIEGQPARVRLDNGRVLTGRAVGERRIEVPM